MQIQQTLVDDLGMRWPEWRLCAPRAVAATRRKAHALRPRSAQPRAEHHDPHCGRAHQCKLYAIALSKAVCLGLAPPLSPQGGGTGPAREADRTCPERKQYWHDCLLPGWLLSLKSWPQKQERTVVLCNAAGRTAQGEKRALQALPSTLLFLRRRAEGRAGSAPCASGPPWTSNLQNSPMCRLIGPSSCIRARAS